MLQASVVWPPHEVVLVVPVDELSVCLPTLTQSASKQVFGKIILSCKIQLFLKCT